MLFCVCQTDTASVLSEAIEYIKFLHEQVTVSPIGIYILVIIVFILIHWKKKKINSKFFKM